MSSHAALLAQIVAIESDNVWYNMTTARHGHDDIELLHR